MGDRPRAVLGLTLWENASHAVRASRLSDYRRVVPRSRLGVHPELGREPAPRPSSLSCVFSLQTSGSWVDGEPSAAVKQAGRLELQFVDIDTAGGTAEVVGVSSNHIVAQLSGWNLHFLDIRPAGSLTITTVFGQESRDGKLKAVHSRTDYLPVSIPGFSPNRTPSSTTGNARSANSRILVTMMLAARYVVLVPLLALVAGVPDAHAQRSLQERLEAATTIDCSYTAIATETGRTMESQEFDTKDAKLSVSFFNVDTQEATAGHRPRCRGGLLHRRAVRRELPAPDADKERGTDLHDDDIREGSEAGQVHVDALPPRIYGVLAPGFHVEARTVRRRLRTRQVVGAPVSAPRLLLQTRPTPLPTPRPPACSSSTTAGRTPRSGGRTMSKNTTVA